MSFKPFEKDSALGVLVWGLLCVLPMGLAGRLSAQVVTGSISGSVVDQSGAAVPGAEVHATSADTNKVYAGATDPTGLFHLALLPIGTYNVEVTKANFRKLALSGVEVNSAQATNLGSLRLEVGGATTTVEVSAAPALVQSSEAQVSTAIRSTTITEFPGVNENQGLDILALQIPGVVNNRDLGFSNTNGVGFAVNGLRGRNNDQQIDGQNNNDNSVAGPYLFLANPDFVDEYQITTNNFGPEYGRNSGSVVNILTKSGTNSWHGDAAITESNAKLDTLSNTQKAFQGLKKVPTFNDEFSSGTIGGPIRKDRLFVFGGFDDEITNQSAVYSTGSKTPTPAGLQQLVGCFPNSASVAALAQFGPFGVKGGNPTPSGTPTTKTLTDPKGNPCPVEFAGVQRNLSAARHEYDVDTRLDGSGEKNHVSGRFLYQKTTRLNANSFGTAAAGYPNNVPSLGEDIGVTWTRNLSATMVNEARVSYGRLTVEFGGNGIGNTIPSQTAIDTALARVNITSGFLGFGPATNAPQGRIVNTYQFQDNWSYFRGKHQLKAGANITYQRSPNVFLPNVNGSFTYANFQKFALNVPRSISVTLGDPHLDFREHDNFFYVGDDYKVKPNLTLNLGLTYSYFGQPANLFHTIDVKRESNASTAFFNPALPLAIRSSPEIPAVKTNLAPSIGFAYTPHWGGSLTGAGKTVLRGGYRLAYDPPYYNIYLNIATAAPQTLSQNLTGAKAAGIPLLAQPIGAAVRNQLGPFLVKGVKDPRSFSETDITHDFGPDRVQGWSFGIQRELVPRAVVEARYVGNHGGNLFQSINGNPDVAAVASFPNIVPAGVTPCPASQAVVPTAIGRANCNLGVVRRRTNTAVSDYEGLQTEFRATNLAQQLTMRMAYTWSKTTDNASEIFGSFAGGGTTAFAQNPFDYVHGEHSLSGLDIPNNFTMSFFEQIPAFRDQQGWKGKLLGGWGVSGTLILSSGQTYTPTQFFINGTVSDFGLLNSFNSGIENLRPFLSNPNAPAENVGIFAADACSFARIGCKLAPNTLLSFNTLNANATQSFTFPSAVRYIVNGAQANLVYNTPYGNAGRNTLRDYHTNVANFALYKEVRVNERVRVQWHMSMENVFNHPNFYSIDPFVDDAGFATEENGFADPRLFSGADPNRRLSQGQRHIRFGLKIMF